MSQFPESLISTDCRGHFAVSDTYLSAWVVLHERDFSGDKNFPFLGGDLFFLLCRRDRTASTAVIGNILKSTKLSDVNDRHIACTQARLTYESWMTMKVDFSVIRLIPLSVEKKISRVT